MKTTSAMLGLFLVAVGTAVIASCDEGGTPRGSTGGAGATGAAGTGTTTGAAGTGTTTGAAGTGTTTGAAGTGTTTGAAGTGTTGAAGTGTTTGAAGTGTAGTGAAGTGAAGTGAAGAGTTGAAGTGAASGGPYTCTQFLGLLTTNEWYSQGFETAVGDGTKFEIKYNHYGYIRSYADPNNAFWTTNVTSPCAMKSNNPDRVVFAALDWEMLTEAEFVTALTAFVNTVKMKYSNLKRVDLMTQIRCPMNKMCNSGANYGPGANMSAPRQDCYIPAYQDAAMAKVAAAMPDLVGLGPKTEATACRQPVDGTHLSGDSNKQAAKDVAAYYLAHP